MRDYALAYAFAIFAALPASGQVCPSPSEKGPSVASEVRTLEGQLVFHDGIRKWFELKLDQPQCGQPSIQLVSGAQGYTPGEGTSIEVLRGCQVRSKGVIDFSPTGYYSLDTYQAVEEIQSVGSCERKLPFPADSNAKPDKTIRAYRVDMHLDYEPGDHPIDFRVTSSGKELRPWQVYASYYLTGGYVLYGHCGDGFVVAKVFGTPEANPQHFEEPRTPEDAAMFDPESATASGRKDLNLGYTCVRKR